MVMLMVWGSIDLNQATWTGRPLIMIRAGMSLNAPSCSATRLTRPARALSSVSIPGSSAPALRDRGHHPPLIPS
jgi:hypothetical protein